MHYPKKNSGMYILSKTDIEFIADKALEEFQPEARDMPMPTELERIAEDHLELSVKERVLSTDGRTLGAMVFHDVFLNYRYSDGSFKQELFQRGTVLLSTGLSEPSQRGRKRFTLAHELGHWLLHRPFHGLPRDRSLITCRTGYMEKERKQCATEHDWEEWQANAFAAALLMPRSTFERAVKSILGSGGFSLYCVEDHGSTYLETAAVLSDLYDVSKTAAALRLKQLGYVRSPYVYADMQA